MTDRRQPGALRRPLRKMGLQFDGLVSGVALPDDPTLMSGLMACLKGMAPRTLPCPPAMCFGTIRQRRDGYCYDGPALAHPMTGLTVTGTVCALIADLTLAACDALPGGIGLHCGAVEIGGRLVLLTGPHRAGKSTLVARLSAEPGLRLFCDDVLPVTAEGFGLALGIAPRLRLPVPEGAQTLRDHLDAHLVLSDDRYGYLMPPSLVAHGDLAQLGGLVVLRRMPPGTPARLHRLSEADALCHLLERTLSELHSAEAAHARVAALIAGLPTMTLAYSDLDEATALLCAAFAPGAQVRLRPPLPEPLAPPVASPDPLDPALVLRPRSGIALRRAEGGGFLWHPGDGILWRLNPAAAAVWSLLTQTAPCSGAHLADLLSTAFPATDPALIRHDTCAILSQFLAADFAECLCEGSFL